MSVIQPKQRGEWWEIGAKVTDPVTKLPIDVTGKTVSQVVRSGPKETDPVVTVDGPASGFVSASAGDVWVGGRIDAAGSYYVTVAVGASSDGRGWPVKEVVPLKINP